MEQSTFEFGMREPARRYLVKATARSIWGLLKYLRLEANAEVATILSSVDVSITFYAFRLDEYPQDSLERDGYWEAIAHTLLFTGPEADELISWLAGRHEFLTGFEKQWDKLRFPHEHNGGKLWNVDFDPNYDLAFGAVGVVFARTPD